MKLNGRALRAEAQEVLRLFPVPGITAAVFRGGQLSDSCALGVRDDQGISMTEDTLFEAASLTKSLFAALFLRLHDRKLLSLDEPVLSQLPDARWSADARFARITPRMALCHNAGLPNWSSRPMALLFEPGTSFSYSGEGYYLLQHLAEQVTRKSLPELFQEEFFIPWGMEDAAGVWSPKVGSHMSLGFGTDGRVVKRRDALDLSGNAPEPNAAWSLYANARIYAQFLCRMIMENGGLSEASFAKMTSRQNDAGGGILWGLGWGIPANKQSVLWHWGDNTGFKSFALWDKDSGDGLTVFTNSDAGVPFYMELCRRLTGETFYTEIASFIASAE
ncbi:MAG: serine hydrolase domain-containing protein [Clostridiaceae bacterium]|nr:serine hydrolase domain-containing protein [Clostridiaceae bacterium]